MPAPTRSVRLTNTGTAALSIFSMRVEGMAFSSTSACPATLEPAAGCDIDVAFTPAAAGVHYQATLKVTSNAAGSPHQVLLSGDGTAAAVPTLVWKDNVDKLDFGLASAGTVTSPTTSVTLVNNGPAGATLSLLNIVGPNAPNFVIAGGTCSVGKTLFRGDPCTIELSFAPGSAGEKNAEIQVASTGSIPPTLALHGTGTGGPSPGLKDLPATLGFATIRVGAQSLPAELTLTSNGSGVVRVLRMEASAPYVVQAKSCPAVPFTLVAGSECTITVRFNPQFEGSAAGVLRIATDADPATREVALSGSGEAAANVSSGGGCSVASGESPADPTLWTMVLLALVVLLYRHRERVSLRRRDARDVRDRR